MTSLHIIVNIFTKYHEDTFTKFWPLTCKCDLDFWHGVMGLVRDTLIMTYILTKLYENGIMTFEVTAWTRSDGRKYTRKYIHSKVANYGDCLAHRKWVQQKLYYFPFMHVYITQKHLFWSFNQILSVVVIWKCDEKSMTDRRWTKQRD